MKKLRLISSIIVSIVFFSTVIYSCKPSAAIMAKSGAQIWGENCIRCHNVASPATFSDVQWDVAAMHMQIRANLTTDEVKKVVAFLKSAN